MLKTVLSGQFILEHFRDNQSFIYNYIEIGIERSVSLWGLVTNQNWSWYLHVTKVLAKINLGTYTLSKMSYFYNIDTLKTIYFAFFVDTSFGLCLYRSTPKNYLDKNFKIKIKNLNILTHIVNYFGNCSDCKIWI